MSFCASPLWGNDDRKSIRFEPESFPSPPVPCLQVHNQDTDIIAEYIGNDHQIVRRAGSWLGRDGRYLLPRPDDGTITIRFRALEEHSIEPEAIRIAPCPTDLPDAGVEALASAVDARLRAYLGGSADTQRIDADYRQAVKAFEASGHRHWLAVTHYEYAAFARAADQLDRAEEHYRAALEGFTAIGDEAGHAAAVNALGLVALRGGRLGAAREYFRRALPLFVELDDQHHVAAVSNNLGLLAMRQGNLDDAASHLDLALSILQGNINLRLPNPGPVSDAFTDDAAELTWALNTLNNLALVRRRQGAVELAERYWRNYLALESGIARAQAGAEVRHNLGALMIRQGRLDEALILFGEALERFETTNARRWIVEARVMMSLLYSRLGDQGAAQHYAEAAIAADTEDRDARVYAYRHFAELLEGEGRHDDAVALYDEALSQFADKGASGLELQLSSERAHVLLQAGRSRDAVEAQRQVLGQLETTELVAEIARARYRLAAALFAADQPAAAEASLDKALPVFEQTGDVFYELQALELLGELPAGNIASHLEINGRALARARTLRQQPLADERRMGLSAMLERIYDRRVQLHIDAGRSADAWRISAEARTAPINDLVDRHRRARDRDQRSALLDEHTDLIDRLHRHRIRSDAPDEEAAAELRQAIDRIETRLAQMRHTAERPTVPSLAGMQRQLNRGQLLLSYYLLPDRFLLWAVTRDGIRLVELDEHTDPEAAATALLSRLRHPRQAPGAIERLAERLGRQLLAPVADELADADELLIQPDGRLHALPFAVLIHDGQPLADRLAVRQVLIGARQSEPASADATDTPLLVLADPGWGSSNDSPGALPRDGLMGQLMRDGLLQRLPGTRREARGIAELADRGIKLQLRTGRQASRQFVLSGGLAGHRMIHMATHGLVDLQYPVLSALLLADDSGSGPAFLRPREIAELELDAELIVLSGCETGYGQIISGEGALSLARPFLIAGAESVISTLWKIDDHRTAGFMRRFYQHLLQDDLSPAESLARTQRWIRRQPETAHPYYWAGFVLNSAAGP